MLSPGPVFRDDPGAGLQAFVEDEAAATVVAVDRSGNSEAAIPTTAGIEEAAVSGQAQRMQVPARIDEGNPRDLVRNDTGEEAASRTDLYGQRRGQEFAGGTTPGAAAPAATNRPEEAGVMLFKPDDVDRGMTTEACSGRNPSACDDDSVSAPEHRQERSWHGVRCSGRALKRSELTGRRLAACRHDCNTSGGDEGCKSEAPHRLAPSSDIKGIMTYTCKSVRLRLQVRGMGQCSGLTPGDLLSVLRREVSVLPLEDDATARALNQEAPRMVLCPVR